MLITEKDVRSRVLLAVAAGLLGAAANLVPVEVFGGVHLSFGGIFSLAAAIALSPAHGALAALIAYSHGFAHWATTPEVALYCAEAAAVGLLVRRRFQPLISDVCFWAAIGIPLLALGYGAILHFSSVKIWALAIKNPLNGLMNVAVAELIVEFAGLDRFVFIRGALQPRTVRRPRRALREQVSHALLLASIVPFLLLNIGLEHLMARRLEHDARARLSGIAQGISIGITDYVDRHRVGLLQLADLFPTDEIGKATAIARLERFHQIYPGLQTVFIADERGSVVVSDLSHSTLRIGLPVGTNVQDRTYFTEAIAGRPHISEAFLGRMPGHGALVTLSAPVRDITGHIRGALVASLNLASFQSFEASHPILRSTSLVIVDRRNRVLYSGSGSPYAPLETLTSTDMLAGLRDGRQEAFTVSASTAEGETAEYLVSHANTPWGWRVVVEEPVLSLHIATQSLFMVTALWILAGIALSVICSRLIGVDIHFTARRTGRTRSQVFDQGRESGANSAARRCTPRSGGTGPRFR